MNFQNGSRAYVDNQTTFILGEGSNLTIGKAENTAGIIGVEGNGKLKINEYKGKDLYNHDNLTTTGGSIGTSGAGISNENHRKEGITRHTVIGNVEIGSATGSPINRDRSKANETTRDDHSSTNVYVESQTIDYALHPAKFKEDVGIAILEGSATVEGALKKIDNILRGDDNSDISQSEKRRYEEIKENIIRVKTAPDMKLIAEGDLSDPDVQKRLGIGGRFNPDDPNLPEKIKDRIAQVREQGQEINYFYDKVTGKIYINENADEDEIRAGIGREWGIRDEFDRGRTKPNGEGQEKGTVAGEIAYKEIEDRTKGKSDKKVNPYDFEYAKFDPDSEVSGDKCVTNLCFEGDRPGQSIPLSTSKNLNNKNNEFSKLHKQLENYCKKSGKCKEEKGVYVFNDEAEFFKYNELFRKTGHRDRVKLDYKKPILKTIADFGVGAIKITGSIIKDTVKDGMFLIAGYSGAISEDMSLGIVKYRDPKTLAPVEINNKSYLMGQAIGHIQMAGAGLSGEIGGNLIEGAAVAGAPETAGVSLTGVVVGEAVKGYSVAVGSYSTVQATITIGKILSSPPTELTSGAESGNKDEKPKQEKSSEPKKEVESKQQENGNQKKSKKETESKKTENKGKSNNENKSNKEQNSNNRNNEISKNQNISEQNQPQSDLNNNSNIERNFNNLSENEKAMFEKYEKNGWKGQVSGGPANAGREYKNDGRLGGEILPKENTKGTITYKEFDINVKTGEFRDGYRFVKGSDGSVYYTDDHYMTFTRVK